MSAAGLASDPIICIKKTFPDTKWSLVEQKTVFDIRFKMNVTVFSMVNHEKKTIIISFAVDEPDGKLLERFRENLDVKFYNKIE